MGKRKKIVLLGVGSTYFTKGIIESLIKYGGQWDVQMVDIDTHCLDIAINLGKRLVEHYKADVTVSGSTNRLDVLKNADAVVSTIGVGGRKAWEQDVLMFRRFNIYQSTGDTFGAGGISRSIRTIPPMLEIASDMEKHCKDALLVNFTNPMSTVCWALNKYSKIKTIGLCYGVTYYQNYLANLIGASIKDTWCKAIGVNHFTWITEFTHKGENAWPMVKEALIKKPDTWNKFAWELFDTFGAFPTVGDGHICEFMPGMQAKGAYYGKTFGVDNGDYSFETYAKRWDDVFDEMADQAYGRKPLALIEDNEAGETFRDEDLFVDVLMAYMGEGPPVERTINLPNNGINTSLPPEAILEVTTLVNSVGFHPYQYESVPVGINAFMQRIAASHALTVEASVGGDKNMVVQALLADSVALDRQTALEIADCIFETHGAYLTHFA